MTDNVNTYEESSQAPEGHDEAMIAKGEALEQAGEPDRPEWLPEKFKSAEDMAQAYSELEKKMSSGQQEQAEETPDNAVDTSPTEVEQVLDNAGLDFSTFQQEYAENGALSDDAYQALEESGFSKDLVNSWIAGQEALARDNTEAVYEVAGGADSYQEMVQWAADNLPDSDIQAFNASIDTGDPNMMRFAVQGLSARYRSEVGNTPKLVQGDTATTSSGAFQSVAELKAAMRDPRYSTDSAYRQQVAAKLAKSDVL